MAIAAGGTVVEWFDYSLFFYLATALSVTFYPNMEGSLILVLATGAVGFVFRPLGAVVFGHIGDTRGRTTALVTSAGLMAVAMLGIGLMPGYDTLGIWGGVGVLVLRALAGFSVGAEYTGIMVYLMETAKPHRRGFSASWAAANSEVGALLAVGSAAVIGWWLGSDGLHDWGWRIPFVFGAVLAALMIPLRRYMVESPVITETTDPRPAQPVRYALRHQRRGIAVSFLISAVGSTTYFLTITSLPTYVEQTGEASDGAALSYGVIAALTAIVVTPWIGLLSDRIGRRAAFTCVVVMVVLVSVPAYLFLHGPVALMIIAVVALAIPAAGWSAVAASAVPEQFDDRGRYSGMSIGYNTATVIFGGLTPPAVAWLIEHTDLPLVPALVAITVALGAGIPSLLLMRNHRATPALGAAETGGSTPVPLPERDNRERMS